MKKLKFNLKTQHAIILFLVICIFGNYMFYNKIYRKYTNRIINLKRKINNLKVEINTEKFKFEKNILVFKKIKKLKRRLAEKEYEINYLKNKVKSKKDILNIIKTLVLQSNIKLSQIELSNEKVENNTGILYFTFKGICKLVNFVIFLDTLESKNKYLIIESYTLTPNPKDNTLWNIDMKLKSVYLIVKS